VVDGTQTLRQSEASTFGYAAGYYGKYLSESVFRHQARLVRFWGYTGHYNRGLEAGQNAKRRSYVIPEIELMLGARKYEDQWFNRE
jgi:hypothetical protein